MMTTKKEKNESPKSSKDENNAGCVTLLKLKKVHLLEIELLRMKAEERTRCAQNHHLQAEKIEINAQLMIKANRQEALAAEKTAEECKRKQKELFKALGQIYKVDFEKSTYCDETGIITVV